MTPGDVIGIPARQVIRCAPANGVVDAEPNYLATIDFDAPDLPWLFSRKPASGPVLPWIALAVIDVTDLQADPLSTSPVGTPADDRRRAVAQSRRKLDVGARPAARYRHRAGRSCAIAVAPGQLEKAGSRIAATWPVSCRCSPAGKTAGLGDRAGRRPHEHGPRMGSGRPRRHAARLFLLAFRDRSERRFRIAGPPAARRPAAARARQAQALARLPDERHAGARPDSGTALDLQVALRPPGRDARRTSSRWSGPATSTTLRRAWSTPATTCRC